MAIVEKVGFCTLCRSRCGTINHVDAGRLVAVRPNPDHPTGKAMCPKGRAAPEIVHSSRRLTAPMRRTAPKGALDPGFVAISWDEALDEIASRLSSIAHDTGPESIAFAQTSGSSSSMSDSVDWVQRFIRSFGSPNTCTSTEICNWHKDTAHAFTFGCGTPPADYRNADLIVLWGHNPANVWLAQAEAIGAARQRGARVAVIDPRKSTSARDAEFWLRVRPGTDGALALGLARHIIQTKQFDEAFVRDWTNAPFLVREDNGRFLRAQEVGLAEDGFVVWNPKENRPAIAGTVKLPALTGIFSLGPSIRCRTAFAHYVAAIDPFDLESVERITSVPAREVQALANAIGSASSVCYHAWTGVGQHTNATQTERAIATLYALTGSFDAPGGNRQIASVPAPVINTMSLMSETQRAKALGLAQRPLGPPAIGAVTASDLYDAIITQRPYPVRALFAFGANLLVSHPAPDRGRRALETLDFYVHCDLFPNPTSEFADIVLPVSSAWEVEALRLGFEISLEAQELVQLRQPIVPRQGDTRSDMEIVFALAPRLGMGELFFDGSIEAACNHLLGPSGLDVATLRRHPEGIRVPLNQRDRKYQETGFATETRKVELYSELLFRHGQPAVPTYIPPAEDLTTEFPLRLISVNSGYFRHSQDRGTSSLRQKRPEPVVEVSSALAAARGFDDRALVRVRSRLGAMTLRVAINNSLADDVVASDYGWWQGAPDLGLPDYPVSARGSANFNALIDERQRDPISGALPMRSFSCDIEPVEAAAWKDFRAFRVVAREASTNEVAALRFVPTDGKALPRFRPGQFIGIRVNGMTRSYSLTGPAGDRPSEYSIGVRKIADGTVSAAIFETIREGDVVELQAPSGRFVIPTHNEFPIVLIAGGIGITPFLSYLETLLQVKDPPSVTLYYASRNAVEHAFATRIERLADLLPNVRVVNFYSRPMHGDVFDQKGRLSVDAIDPALIQARARFYFCAGAVMIDEMCAGLMARGVPRFEIFREYFRTPMPPPDTSDARYEIHFSRSGRSLTWSSGCGPLLPFAERNGIILPNGCRVGQCESCAIPIIAGTVRYLTDLDVDADQCLTCQAIPCSSVTLDA